MREPRNPFKWRASENIVNDSAFLRLFGVKALDLLPEDPWSKVVLFQSAPGAGKTSLLRVFTPSALISLFKNKTNEDYKDLFRKVEAIGAFSDNGPSLLSIMLSCSQGYAMLEDLDLDAAQKERLLYSLLNVRIILAALRGACILKNLDYPKDLNKIYIDIPVNNQTLDWVGVPVPCNGMILANWAIKIEESICDAIDSFDSQPMSALKGHDNLYSLQLLRPDVLTYDGKTFIEHVVVMLDDVHKLTSRQREKLLGNVIDQRWPVGVWIAERIEALSKKELLSVGSSTGRDYVTVLIEDYWREHKKFENIVSNIADKRISLIPELHTSSFAGMLDASLDESQYEAAYEKAYFEISNRLNRKFGSDVRFKEWLEDKKLFTGSSRERALEWRTLEILIERKVGEAQLSLPLPYSIAELESNNSTLQKTAEFFISQEFNLPYYYDISSLAILASSNFDQFLDFSGEIFEQILPSIVLNRTPSLSPKTQQEILKKVADRRWHEIPRRIPNGREVMKLLTSIIEYAKNETNRPSAPYAPGVTGIGLSEKDRSQLLNEDLYTKKPGLRTVATLLADCLSNNLLEPRVIRQGQKDQVWMVLYLNRWICLHSDLPLQFGGWRAVSTDRLIDWVEKGYQLHEGQRRLF